MRKLPILLLLGGAALLLLSLTKAGLAVKSLVFKIVGINISCAGILCTSPDVNLKILIRNPSGQDFDIRSLTGDFYFNGTYVGDASSLVQLTIPPYSEVIYPVTASLSAPSVVEAVKGLFSGGIKGELGIKGTLNISGLPVPVDTSYRIV